MNKFANDELVEGEEEEFGKNKIKHKLKISFLY